jgi:hypothetical protein
MKKTMIKYIVIIASLVAAIGAAVRDYSRVRPQPQQQQQQRNAGNSIPDNVVRNIRDFKTALTQIKAVGDPYALITVIGHPGILYYCRIRDMLEHTDRIVPIGIDTFVFHRMKCWVTKNPPEVLAPSQFRWLRLAVVDIIADGSFVYETLHNWKAWKRNINDYDLIRSVALQGLESYDVKNPNTEYDKPLPPILPVGEYNRIGFSDEKNEYLITPRPWGDYAFFLKSFFQIPHQNL